jgi:hypothetical protein
MKDIKGRAGLNASQLMPKCCGSINKLFNSFLGYVLQINSSVENGSIYPYSFSNKLHICKQLSLKIWYKLCNYNAQEHNNVRTLLHKSELYCNAAVGK